MNEILLKRPHGICRWLRLYKLYLTSFPASERKPFATIVKMYRKGKSDVWSMEREGKILGFASTVNGGQTILVDYLAVDGKHRGEGVGTASMLELLEIYAGKGVFVEIESTYDDVPDREARLRRKRFYENCGLEQMNVCVSVFDVRMELMGSGCVLTYASYRDFYREYYSACVAEHILPADQSAV